jgi:hypothetical protein
MLRWDEQRGCLVRNPRSTIDAATEWVWRRFHLVNPGGHWNGSFWEAHPDELRACCARVGLPLGQAGEPFGIFGSILARTRGKSIGYAIVDPDTPERVARDAAQMRSRGLTQLCTTVDAWAPEAQEYNLGRRCLEAILTQPDWTVRILTKNVAVQWDYDLIKEHRDRVSVGLSLTATLAREAQISVVESNASRIGERQAALREAHRLGLRTYGMLSPLLSGIADDREAISELVGACLGYGAEEIFVEPVNARGAGFKLTQEALLAAGFEEGCSGRTDPFVGQLVGLLHKANCHCPADHGGARSSGETPVPLYPDHLTDADLGRIRRNDADIKWLGN